MIELRLELAVPSAVMIAVEAACGGRQRVMTCLAAAGLPAWPRACLETQVGVDVRNQRIVRHTILICSGSARACISLFMRSAMIFAASR